MLHFSVMNIIVHIYVRLNGAFTVKWCVTMCDNNDGCFLNLFIH